MNEHLGGFKPGGDPATYFPDLWSWLIYSMNVRTVLDVGCGEGHALKYFREHGCKVLGVDGIPQSDPDIEQHDYTKGPFAAPRCDLVWSCEFVEHVEERFAPTCYRLSALLRWY